MWSRAHKASDRGIGIVERMLLVTVRLFYGMLHPSVPFAPLTMTPTLEKQGSVRGLSISGILGCRNDPWWRGVLLSQ